MKICIVGNGKGSLQFENGSFIDSCDLVVRMNRFELSTQLAPHLGTRTDIYLTDIKGLFDRTPEEIRNFREIWFPTPSPPSTWNTTTLPDWKRCQEEILREVNYVETTDSTMQRWRLSFRRMGRLKYVKPSTGWRAIQMVFHRYPRAQVYITGFDGFASGHYFEENAEKFCHPWNAEQQQIQAWADSGKLIILDRETSR